MVFLGVCINYFVEILEIVTIITYRKLQLIMLYM
jgi:hypothetical protein